MSLSLEITGEMAEGLGPNMSCVFGENGGTIGRGEGNDWILTDPFISSRHLLVTHKRGEYYIRDTSTNGTFVNDPKMKKRRRGNVRLKDGDTLYIGRYVIRVSIYPDLPNSCPQFSEGKAADGVTDAIELSDEAQEALDDLLNTSDVSAIHESLLDQNPGQTPFEQDNQDNIRDLLVSQGIDASVLTPELTEAVDRIVKETVASVMNNAFGNAVNRALEDQLKRH